MCIIDCASQLKFQRFPSNAMNAHGHKSNNYTLNVSSKNYERVLTCNVEINIAQVL